VPVQSNAALTVSPGPNGMAAHSERGRTAVKQAPGHRQVKGVRRDRFVGDRVGEGDLPVLYGCSTLFLLFRPNAANYVMKELWVLGSCPT
jgi:hypothetical protein